MTAAERRARDRHIWRVGLLVSLLVHVVVFLLWRHQPVPLSPFAAAGPRAHGAEAARGSMQAMNLSSPPSIPVVPPPVPLPSEVDIEPLEFDDMPKVDLSGMGEEVGLEAPGAGTPTGTGAGDGGTAEEGLFRMVPPSPRGMIIPPSNDNLKGAEIQVWVFVDERGRVVPDSTTLRPPTKDRKFNERLIQEAAEWVFEPARKGGEPVATWFPYKISM